MIMIYSACALCSDYHGRTGAKSHATSGFSIATIRRDQKVEIAQHLLASDVAMRVPSR